MSKILLLTLAWPIKGQTNIYKDLMDEFFDNGHEVFVLTTLERRFGKKSLFYTDNGIKVHRVACGNITETGYVEKIVSLLLLNRLFISTDNRHFDNVFFDIILISTPSITLSSVAYKLKKRHKAFLYLLLKDMWPQGAVDAGVLKKNWPIWRFFRYHEKKMYKTADKIGCMSRAAIQFLLTNNPDVESRKVEVCPNSLRENQHQHLDKKPLLNRYNIPSNKLLIIYGGNISLSHGFDFLLECIDHVKTNNVHFVIVGSGTHFNKVKITINEKNLDNITLLKRLPYTDYRKLLACADFGIVLLNRQYTVPQFPSKAIDYLRLGKPVLSITNNNADIGSIIENNRAGFAITSYKKKDFAEIIEKIISNPEVINQASHKAKDLFKREYTTRVCYNRIMNSYKYK